MATPTSPTSLTASPGSTGSPGPSGPPVPPAADLLALVRASFRGSPHPVLLFNENLRILTANPAAAKQLGCTVGQAVGKPIFANLKDLKPADLTALSELLRGKRDVLDIEVTTESSSGHQWRRLTMQAVPHGSLPVANQQRTLFALHITNLTGQRAAEQRLRRTTRLNELLQTLSAEVLDTRWEQVEEDIRRAMGRLGRLLEATRLQLRTTSARTKSSTVEVEWTAPGYNDAQGSSLRTPLDTATLQRLFRSLSAETGTASELDLASELPDTANDDEVAVAPITVGRHQVATLVAVRPAGRSWRPDELTSLSTFGNIVTQLRTRATVEAGSRQRLSVEDLVRQVATQLIEITPDQGRASTEAALAQLGEFFDVRRVMRWRYELEGDRVTVTEAWSGDQVDGLGLRPRELNVRPDIGLAEVVQLTEPVGHLFNSADLFDEAQLPAGSFLLVPLVTGGATSGALVFERLPGAAWHELEIRALETIAALVGQLDARIEAERYLSSSFSQAPVGILLTDENHNIVASNPAFAKFLGVEADSLLNGELADYVESSQTWLADAVDGFKGELAFTRPDHRTVWGRVNSVQIPAPAGMAENVLSYVEDITHARRNRERLEFQANHDELTGLCNRRVLVDELTGCVGNPAHPNDAAVLMIDLDRFKVVNDSLGHSVGDEILRTIADRLQLAVRDGDLVSRLGGDEFVVLIRGPVGELEAVAVAQRIIDLVKDPIKTGVHEVYVTGSVGIAFPNPADRKTEDVLSHADAAMYEAKNKGRNRYEIFDEQSREAVANRIETEGQLRRAIANNELEVYYQPEYDLVNNVIVGAESLIRWNHPEDGVLTAGLFIDIAEDTGLVGDIGSFVLREACRQGAEWNARRAEPLTIRVNLSARQLEQESIVAEVADVLEETGLPAELLCLEITETALMADVDESMRLLNELRSTGVRLAVDDFGTGFSSLAYLKRFPVDILKIDQAFIRHLDTDPTDEAIVLSIIRLAEALDLDVVAEGIEETSHHHKLVDMGCRRGQGFGLARPAPASAVESLLELRTHAA